jgi:acyl-homoserine-lactone acylase
VSTVTLKYRTPAGTLASKTFTVYRTHHGPIVAEQNGKWIAEALMYRPIRALEQSYLRTKATDFASFRKIAELKANSSNNTIFADDKGEIAYMHPQFMPRRDDRFDYTKPVDGSNPATDWHGLMGLDEMPHLLNPGTGWLYNSNNWPYSAAGPDSPKRSAYPKYMDTVGETNRGVHALALLTGSSGWTMQKLRAAAFDSHMPLFAALVPALLRAYDSLPANDKRRPTLDDPITTLRNWDDRWGNDSIPTSLAIFWAEALSKLAGGTWQQTLLATTPEQKLDALSHAVDTLDATFGTWKTPWGNINRFQRITDDIHPQWDDSKPSIPVPFVAGIWGSLAAFYADPGPHTKKRYGHAGNSFVAVVEFGKRVRAIAVTAGGESGNPKSPHFDDEAERYATGNLRTVYFYPDQLIGHTERTYHP